MAGNTAGAAEQVTQYQPRQTGCLVTRFNLSTQQMRKQRHWLCQVPYISGYLPSVYRPAHWFQKRIHFLMQMRAHFLNTYYVSGALHTSF